MPLYEYLCDSCGQRIEALQRLADPPLEVCPHCDGRLKKLLSAPAFQFKGSGWYVTDYARSGGGSGKAGERHAGNEAASAAEKSDKGDKSEKGESPAAPAAPSAPKPPSSD